MTLIISNKDGLYADRRLVIHDDLQDVDGFIKGTKLFTCPDKRYHVAYTGNVPRDWKLYADSVYGFAMKAWLLEPKPQVIDIEVEGKTGYQGLSAFLVRTPWFLATWKKNKPTTIQIHHPDQIHAEGSTTAPAKMLLLEIRQDGQVLHPACSVKEVFFSTALHDSCVSSDFDSGLISVLTKRKPAYAKVSAMAAVPDFTPAKPKKKDTLTAGGVRSKTTLRRRDRKTSAK